MNIVSNLSTFLSLFTSF